MAVELATSTGNNRGGANILYVAITGEDRVLAIDLREPTGGSDHGTAYVADYARAGVNAPLDFESPDNLALDRSGNLYISEDPGGVFASGKRLGDDIWVATPDAGEHPAPRRRSAGQGDGGFREPGVARAGVTVLSRPRAPPGSPGGVLHS